MHIVGVVSRCGQLGTVFRVKIKRGAFPFTLNEHSIACGDMFKYQPFS